jgi:hypothetical protein
MRKSNWTPSIVPNGCDQSVYLVMDDFGRLGRVWREADVEYTNFETVVLDLLEGQCEHPIRVVCFNSAEQWSQDVWSTSPGSCGDLVSFSSGILSVSV